MKRLNLLLILIASYELLSAQSFYKIYDFTPKVDHAAYQIAKLDSATYVVSYFSVCGDPITRCCGIFKMDAEGNVLEKNKITNFSNSTRALLVDTSYNRIIYAGEDDINPGPLDELVVNEIKMDDFSKIKKHSYRDKSYPYFSVSQLSSCIYNGKIAIAGSGNVDYPANVDTANAFIYFLNDDLAIDTSLYFRFSNSINNDLYEMYEDAIGNLTLHFYHNAYKSYIRILKLDKSYKVVFDWETEIRANNNRPRGCALRDGRILLVKSNYPNALVPEIRAINADTTASWTYVWPYSPANRRSISSMSQAANGDIIGVGAFRDSLNRKWMPFIFRMTSDGNLLWEKAFYNISNKEVNAFGDFGDIIETDNGDLIAVGFINQRVSFGQSSFDDQDIFIVRVDGDGCLYSSCDKITGVENTVVGSIDILDAAVQDKISIYPNPTYGSNVNVSLKNPKGLIFMEVYDVYGRLVSHVQLFENENAIDLKDLTDGLYIMKVIKDAQVIKVEKFMLKK